MQRCAFASAVLLTRDLKTLSVCMHILGWRKLITDYVSDEQSLSFGRWWWEGFLECFLVPHTDSEWPVIKEEGFPGKG